MSFETGSTPEDNPPPIKKNPVRWMWILFGSVVVCGCLIVPVGIALILPIFIQSRNQAQKSECMANLKALGTAEAMYTQDYDGLLMTSAWMDGLLPYAKREILFHCPAADQGRKIRYGYAMSVDLVGKAESQIGDPATTVLAFDSIPMGRNAVSDISSLPEPPRHSNNVVLYLTGQVKALPR